MLDNTVLFVDDQDEILYLIKRMLKDESYKTLFAKSGEEALDLIENNHIDVIVTDVIMPEMSGLELLDIVKESHPEIVRIILSGFSQIPTLLSAINNGKIFRYITKPWQVDDEAKQIIQDAIEYANLMKDQPQDEMIGLDSFCRFLEKKDDVFVITKNNKLVYIQEEMSNQFKLNQSFSMKETDNNKELVEYSLSPSIKVYIYER